MGTDGATGTCKQFTVLSPVIHIPEEDDMLCHARRRVGSCALIFMGTVYVALVVVGDLVTLPSIHPIDL